MYVERLSDEPGRFLPGSELRHADGRLLVVERARAHRSRFLVKFEGVDDRSAAEGLRGRLFISADHARSLDDDEYWPEQLTGCTAVLRDGRRVGEVVRVDPGPAQDILVLSTPSGERLVPLVKAIVVSVDVPERRVVLAPPEGLLDE